MKKLRFKNRGGILYFGIDGKFKSSKLKYTNINKNIIIGKFKSGKLNKELELDSVENEVSMGVLLRDVMDAKATSLKHKSIITYKAILKQNVMPYFDAMMPSRIKPIHIKKWHDTLIEKGLARSSISTARVLLKEAFNIAIMNEHIDNNPADMVKVPRIKKAKVKQKPFTLDEIDLILDSDVSIEFKNFFGISCFTGMRSGEILALKWEDIDFDTETISISKTIAQGVINSPKTFSSNRDIEMLEKTKEYFKSQQLQTGIKDSYVFLNNKSNYFGSNHVFYKYLQEVLKELGLEKRSLHNTRHSFASLMLNNGIDLMWVSNTLGHENLSITLKIYAHFIPRKEKMKLGFLEKRYKNGTNNL